MTQLAHNVSMTMNKCLSKVDVKNTPKMAPSLSTGIEKDFGNVRYGKVKSFQRIQRN